MKTWYDMILNRNSYRKTSVAYHKTGFFPAKDMQIAYPPCRHNCFHFHDRCAQCWIDWKINFPNFIFWVIADCIYNLLVTRRVKKNSSKVVKFTGKIRNEKSIFCISLVGKDPHSFWQFQFLRYYTQNWSSFDEFWEQNQP